MLRRPEALLLAMSSARRAPDGGSGLCTPRLSSAINSATAPNVTERYQPKLAERDADDAEV